MSKRKYPDNQIVDVFADLYNKTVDVHHHIPQEGVAKDPYQTKKPMPKVEDWYPIYSDTPNSYQADLMFEPYLNSKNETILQAILCVINVNTKYAFAQAMDYTKNYKGMDEEDWKKKPDKRLRLSHKEAPLVLRSFKRIEQDMTKEATLLNRTGVYGTDIKFQIDTLYVDEGGEFKGVFKNYCESKGIHVHPFLNVEFDELKWRLGIVERFNRTLRGLLEKEKAIQGKKPFKDLLPQCLAKYNRHTNHRGVSAYFRRDNYRGQYFRPKTKGQKRPVRLFPAMMLVAGSEQKYMAMKKQRTREVDSLYHDTISELKPGALVRYYKRPKGKFQKERGSTMSEPVEVKGVHRYSHRTGYTRTGERRANKIGSSYELKGVRARFMPYELELWNPKKKKASVPRTFKKIRIQEIRKENRKPREILV